MTSVGASAKKFVGFDTDSLLKHVAVASLNKEAGEEFFTRNVRFLTPDQVTDLATGTKAQVGKIQNDLANEFIFTSPFGRMLESSLDTIGKMGEGGQQISSAVQKTTNDAFLDHNSSLAQLSDVVGADQIYKLPIMRSVRQKLGLKKKDLGKFGVSTQKGFEDQFRTVAAKMDDGGLWLHERKGFENAARPTKETEEQFTILRNWMDGEATKNTQAGVTKIDFAGNRVPFTPRENYFPRFYDMADETPLRKDMLNARATSEGFKDFDTVLREDKLRSQGMETLVNKDLQNMKDDFVRQKFGALEGQRHFDFPGYLGDWRNPKFRSKDAIEALVRYSGGVSNRRAFINNFGQEVTESGLPVTVQTALDSIAFQTENLPGIQREAAAFAKDFWKAYSGTSFLDARGRHQIISNINSFQVVNKLAVPLSFLTNLTQSSNTALVSGVQNTFKGMAKASKDMWQGDLSQPQRFGAVINSIISEERVVSSPFTRFSDVWLEWTGFNKVERWNRSVAGYAGLEFGDELAEAILRYGKDE